MDEQWNENVLSSPSEAARLDAVCAVWEKILEQEREAPASPEILRFVPFLGKALRDSSWSVRGFAAQSLHALGESAISVLPQLIQALDDPKEDVRASVVDTLRKLGPQARGATNGLLRLLDDKTQGVRLRAAAATALGRIGPAAKDAIPSLLFHLEFSESPISDQSAMALGCMGKAAVEAMPLLLEILMSQSRNYPLVEVRAALEQIDQDLEQCALCAAENLKSWNASTRKLAASELGRLFAGVMGALPQDTESSRYKAQRALQDHVERVLPLLRKGLQDPDPTARQAIVEAMAKIEGSKLLPAPPT